MKNGKRIGILMGIFAGLSAIGILAFGAIGVLFGALGAIISKATIKPLKPVKEEKCSQNEYIGPNYDEKTKDEKLYNESAQQYMRSFGNSRGLMSLKSDKKCVAVCEDEEEELTR